MQILTMREGGLYEAEVQCDRHDLRCLFCPRGEGNGTGCWCSECGSELAGWHYGGGSGKR